jgi:hypothetical protein
VDRLRGTAAQHDEVGEKLKTLRGRATGQKVKTSGFPGRSDHNGSAATLYRALRYRIALRNSMTVGSTLLLSTNAPSGFGRICDGHFRARAPSYQTTRVIRPEEFHLRPLAEPDVNLSAHPAPIIQPTTYSKACRSWRIPPGRPVDLPCLLDDAAPSLHRHYDGLNATTNGSVPWRCIATVGLAFGGLCPSLNITAEVPAVQRKSLKQDRAASMPDAVWPVSRYRPN